MNDEYKRTRRGHTLICVDIPGENEENERNSRPERRSPVRDLNPASPECKAGVLISLFTIIVNLLNTYLHIHRNQYTHHLAITVHSKQQLTYLLTPWCGVLLQKLTGLQLVKKFPAIHATRRFITALTSVRHLSLSWASPIQSVYPHPTSWRSILCCAMFPLETLPPPRRSEWGSSLPPDCFVSRASIPHVSVS